MVRQKVGKGGAGKMKQRCLIVELCGIIHKRQLGLNDG